jgi:type IV fimbrial biogenesis protein FimT
VKKDKGFTIIELMIVLGIMSVILTLAATGFVDLRKNNLLLSEVYSLRASINKARSEALVQRTFVIICRSSDGSTCTPGDWNAGYIGFTDADGTGNPSDPNAIILSHTVSDQLAIDYNAPDSQLRFNSRGFALGFDGTLTVCDDRGAEFAKALIVLPVGGVRAAMDDPDSPDGIVNVNDGAGNVSC